jgi:hypothetical protein
MPRGKSPARRTLFNFVGMCAVAALYLILQPPQAITAGRAVAVPIFASVSLTNSLKKQIAADLNLAKSVGLTIMLALEKDDQCRR